MKISKDVLFLLMTLNCVFSVLMNVWFVLHLDDRTFYLDKDEMWVNKTGVYYYDEFYCVETKSRDECHILMTMMHEHCHHLVYNDYRHFCGAETK